MKFICLPNIIVFTSWNLVIYSMLGGFKGVVYTGKGNYLNGPFEGEVSWN